VSGPPRRGANGMGSLPGWADLESAVPQITATMRRYLTQISCVLRPGSVGGADLALRAFAGFLAETAPEVTSTAQVTRRHIEDYKPWLAARPGQNKPRLTTATIAHRLGTLRMFFVRLDEWGWDEAPPRVPMFPGDLPRQDHPLPKALDDASAARLLRAAQNDKRLLVRVTVEMLLRTGLRVSEYTSLRADAVVHIGAGPWLHVPVGKLREDRYLPLHPHLVALIDDYRAAHVAAGNPLLLPRENGKPADRHAVTRPRGFLAWAATQRHCPAFEVPPPAHQAGTALGPGQRWELAARLLHDGSLQVTDRAAGCLVLLFGQNMTRIAALTTSDVTCHGQDVCIRLGQHQAPVPKPLGRLLLTLAREGKPYVGIGSRPASRWLFPGLLPGRPITPARLAERLRALGIPVKAARRAALIDLAAQLPAAVLADLLGLHPTTAVTWMHQAGGDWTRYAALLARTRNHQP
jgi:integrase